MIVMTDYAIFLDLLSRGRVRFETKETVAGNKVVTVQNSSSDGKPDGYCDFFSEWLFDATDGRLLEVAHWE